MAAYGIANGKTSGSHPVLRVHQQEKVQGATRHGYWEEHQVMIPLIHEDTLPRVS